MLLCLTQFQSIMSYAATQFQLTQSGFKCYVVQVLLGTCWSFEKMKASGNDRTWKYGRAHVIGQPFRKETTHHLRLFVKNSFPKKTKKKPYKILIETNGAIKPVTLPMVMWLDGWGPLIVSHHPAKFYGHKHCGAGGMFLIVEKHDSTCLFKSSNIVYH